MMTTHFKQMLLNRIEKKNVLLGMHQQFQDLHWDDVYNVYYDSSSI